jgi:hypothetical protein
VGRINEIHVVVPLIEDDGRILLQVAKGGIFSYYEFPHPAEDRLTDARWRQMLDEAEAPEPPVWIDSFFTPEGEFSELQEAVYKFQQNLVQNLFYLTPPNCCGQAASQLITEINALQAKKQYEGRQWMHTHYRSFDRQSDTLAVVTVREAWRDQLHQYKDFMFTTGQADPIIAKRGPYDLEVTYTLEQNEIGGWEVTRLVYNNERPAWQPCATELECMSWE